MSVPESLDELIRVGHDAMRVHPAHVLQPRYRAAIAAAMGPWDSEADPSENEGRRRRVILALQSALRVLPIWEQRWPQERAPHDAIAATERLLRSPGDADVYYDVINQCMYDVERARSQDFVKSLSGQSAVLALVTALEDEPMEPATQDALWLDGQEAGGDDDSASAASIAYSGGSAVTVGADAIKRREFWKWWLTEAVPYAYREGTLGGQHRSSDRIE